jgi:hypothetical protein
MPTIIRVDGYSFRIYLNDHTPAHTHVVKAENEARVTLETIAVMNNLGFNQREIKRILEIAIEHQDELLAAWDEYHADR